MAQISWRILRSHSSCACARRVPQDVALYMNLFEHKMKGLKLSPQEVQAVYAFLAVNLEVGSRPVVRVYGLGLGQTLNPDALDPKPPAPIPCRISASAGVG